MALISWGKPDLYYKDLSDTSAKWKKAPTPADGTTELSTEKGDKTEAKLEGGEIEDVRYDKSTYSLAYQIRRAKGKTMPFKESDGIVDGEFAIAVVPEDPKCPGLLIDKSHVSAETTYSAEEGLSTTYTHDALKPESGNQVKYGVLTVTESGGEVTDITIVED